MKTTGLHKVNPLLKIDWVKIVNSEKKTKVLLDVLNMPKNREHKKTIVFVNTSEDALVLRNVLEHSLKTKVSAVHSKLSDEDRYTH